VGSRLRAVRPEARAKTHQADTLYIPHVNFTG
jgi:hypothetical protein